MKELFKFLLRIAIRVLIVITIGAWGASRIYEVNVVYNHRGHEVLASAEAAGLSAQYGSSGIGWGPRLRIYVNQPAEQQDLGRWKIFPDGQGFVLPGNNQLTANFLGIQAWRSPPIGTKLRISYLTLIIALVVGYAFMRRRRPSVAGPSLRSRLQAKLTEFCSKR